MKKLYSKLFRNFVSVSIFMMLIADVIFVLYFIGVYSKNAQNVLDTTASYSASLLERLNEETNRINTLIQTDSQIQQMIREIPENRVDTFIQKLETNGYLYTLQSNNTVYIDSFYILMDDGRQFKSTNFPLLYEKAQDIPEYEELRKYENETWVSVYETSMVANNHKSGYVSVVYPLYNVRTGDQAGIVLEEIQTKTIETALLSACSLEGVNAEIHDERGNVLLSCGEDRSMISGTIIRSSTEMINGWELVLICPIWTLIGGTIGVVVFLFVLLAFLLICITIRISKKMAEDISAPVELLLQEMESDNPFERDNKSIDTDIYEIDRLVKKYDFMIKRMKELFEELERKQQDVRKSEYAALQAQINPHFLYNTLDNITWRIRSGDSKDAIEEVMGLSRFFRLSLSKGADMVPVGRELEHVAIYLSILKKRYVRKFDFEVTSTLLEADQEHSLVPKLILQPLAENAVYHGFETVQEGGKIQVSAFLTKDEIQMEVYDNGSGISPKRLELIQNQLKGGKALRQESETGYGIFNIHDRIQNLFGNNFGLELESECGRYTIARIRLPRGELSNKKE